MSKRALLLIVFFVAAGVLDYSYGSKPASSPNLPKKKQPVLAKSSFVRPLTVAKAEQPKIQGGTNSTPSLNDIREDFDLVDKQIDGLSLVKRGDRYGFVNQRGELVTGLVFDTAFRFSEDRAVVEQDGKFGYIDPQGNFTVTPQFDYAWPINHGAGLVKEGNLYGYVGADGKLIVDPIFETTWGFTQGLAAVELNGKFGFIDQSGGYVVSPMYDYAWPYEIDGTALVKLGSEYFKIDRSGNRVNG